MEKVSLSRCLTLLAASQSESLKRRCQTPACRLNLANTKPLMLTGQYCIAHILLQILQIPQCFALNFGSAVRRRHSRKNIII